MTSERKWRLVSGIHGMVIGTAVGIFLQQYFHTRWADPSEAVGVGRLLGWMLVVVGGLLSFVFALRAQKPQ